MAETVEAPKSEGESKKNIIRMILIFLSVSVMIYVFFIYKVSGGSPVTATSPYHSSVIESEMAQTNHLRYLETIGTTNEGETIFTYQWYDYGAFEGVFGEDGANHEDDVLSEQLKIERLD